MELQRTESPIEEELGMTYYSTNGPSIGGVLRQLVEDFCVEEITMEGRVANPSLKQLNRGEGRHTLVLLGKKSRDLLTVVSDIRRRLHTEVGFAGIKDRRAASWQVISLGMPLQQDDMPQDIKNTSLNVLGASRWAVLPGELRGNRFTIAIRNIKTGVSGASIDATNWLPGYFGHQRFGTTRPNTHKIGRMIVKGDFQAAVSEFLSVAYPHEPAQIRNARLSLMETWDLERSYREFPPSLYFEKAVIKKLISRPSDYEGALAQLPETLQRFFVNSYQSYLFNHALSRRWAMHGLFDVSEGDYVSPLDKWGSPSRPIKPDSSNIGPLRRMIANGKAVLMVRIVGVKTRLEGVDLEIYEKLLEEEGISLGDFSRKLGQPFLGALRFATFKPIELGTEGPVADELNPGTSKITLRTSLPKSCYATVVLREIMRPADPFLAGF